MFIGFSNLEIYHKKVYSRGTDNTRQLLKIDDPLHKHQLVNEDK